MARRASGLAIMLIGVFLLLAGLLAIPGVGIYTLPTVSLTQGAVLTPTSQTGSWNTNVKCLATVTTLSNIFNGRYNSSTGGALPYGTGYVLLPNVPQTFSGIEQS